MIVQNGRMNRMAEYAGRTHCRNAARLAQKTGKGTVGLRNERVRQPVVFRCNLVEALRRPKNASCGLRAMVETE